VRYFAEQTTSPVNVPFFIALDYLLPTVKATEETVALIAIPKLFRANGKGYEHSLPFHVSVYVI